MTKKILVIDDDPEDYNRAKKILEEDGYHVSTIDNGSDALDELKSKSFDLVLLDINMPTFSGRDFLVLLKSSIKDKTPVVYISAVPRKDVNMRGVAGFVQKPYGKEALTDMVNQVLG